MTNPAHQVHATVAKVWDFTYQHILLGSTAGRDLRLGDSSSLHRVLCAYAAHHANPSTPLPPDVMEAAAELTDGERALLTVLGEIGQECRDIERAVNEEWALLPKEMKDILAANARDGEARVQAFSEGMPLWQSIMSGVATGGAITWDIWLGIKGPDSSLLPRFVALSAGTFTAVLGFLISPGNNFSQFFESIFQDRVVLGLPQRLVYTVATKDLDFYEDRTSYIASVASAGSTLLLLLTMPEPVQRQWHDHRMSKMGSNMASDGEEVHQLAGQVRDKAPTLDALQKKLETVVVRHIAGDGRYGYLSEGTTDQIGRIRGQTRRVAELLLRAASAYSPETHAEHGEKLAVVVAWNSLITAMLIAAKDNPAQIGVLIPYIVHSERRMLETLFDTTKGSRDMVALFTRSGANALYQFLLVSIPLFARGSTAFDDPALQRWVTGALTAINVTVIQYTPAIFFLIGEGGRKLAHLVQRAFHELGSSHLRRAGDLLEFEALPGHVIPPHSVDPTAELAATHSGEPSAALGTSLLGPADIELLEDIDQMIQGMVADLVDEVVAWVAAGGAEERSN